ncbi:MAG: response regulator [Magnetococcales bacterium]|nr:response regulator [Magnetococcales bacterium]
MKILIADDNAQEIRVPLRRQLGRMFGEDAILEADNGQAAVRMAERYHPEVVILDIMMPVMNGIDACRALRGKHELAATYIIMLTGRDGGLPEGLEAGADVYLRKPYVLDELIAVVGKGLEESARLRAFREREQVLEKQVGNLNESLWAFQEIVTSLGIGVILCAPTPLGPIRYMNPAAVRLVGRPTPGLRDQPVGILFQDRDVGQLLEDILAHEKPLAVPKRVNLPSGKSFPVLLSGRLISDTKGQEKWIMLEVGSV